MIPNNPPQKRGVITYRIMEDRTPIPYHVRMGNLQESKKPFTFKIYVGYSLWLTCNKQYANKASAEAAAKRMIQQLRTFPVAHETESAN